MEVLSIPANTWGLSRLWQGAPQKPGLSKLDSRSSVAVNHIGPDWSPATGISVLLQGPGRQRWESHPEVCGPSRLEYTVWGRNKRLCFGRWKTRPNSSKLSFRLHKHVVYGTHTLTHTHTHKISKIEREPLKFLSRKICDQNGLIFLKMKISV